MKKIVALVLALVLALSLATVAFAADEAYFSTKVGGMKMTGVTLKETKAAGEKNVAVYTPVVTVNGKEVPMMLSLVEATEADYDYVFVNGEKVTYLMNSVNGAYTGEAALVKTVDADDAVCGDIVAEDGVALYVMDGKYYKAMGSWNLRSALNKATKDYMTEQFYDMVGFTKSNLESALKEALVTKASTTVAQLLAGNIPGVVMSVINAAKTEYGSEVWGGAGDKGPGVEKLFLRSTDFVDALTDALTVQVGTETTISLFATIGSEVIGNVVTYVADKLGLEADAKDPDPVTDADFNGENLMLNIAREIGKQGTSVKAIALVDGKLITLAAAVEGDDYNVVAHEYEATVEDGKITKVACSECGAEFNFVVGCEKDAVAAFGEGNYANITNEFKYPYTTKFLGKHSVTIGADAMDWDTMTYKAKVDWKAGTGYAWDLLDEDSRNVMKALGGKQLYISTAAAEVESAKTFDAGVALYAGMALMSVTGSAIVIGKKKEF